MDSLQAVYIYIYIHTFKFGRSIHLILADFVRTLNFDPVHPSCSYECHGARVNPFSVHDIKVSLGEEKI